MPLKIAILASGSGTNAQAMIDKAAQGVLDVSIALIVCNRPGAGVVARAEKAGIPCLVLDHKTFADRESFDREMVAAIGPVTAKTLADNGLPCHIQPEAYTIPALVEALKAHYSPQR